MSDNSGNDSNRKIPNLRIVKVEEPPSAPSITIKTIRRGGAEGSMPRWLPWTIAALSLVLALLSIVALIQKDSSPVVSKAAPPVEDSEDLDNADDIESSPTVHTEGSRSYIKKFIDGKDNCRIVAITKRNGDVAVANDNDWAVSSCPDGLKNALQSVSNDDKTIIDVCLTESGNWIVVYDFWEASWRGIPYDLEAKIREFCNNCEEIYSVSFNDAGDWIIVTEDHYSSSNTYLQSWLRDGSNLYGRLLSAVVSEDAAVAVFETGYRFYGNVPQDLKRELQNTDVDVRIIKIAGNAWFFADEEGRGKYSL